MSRVTRWCLLLRLVLFLKNTVFENLIVLISRKTTYFLVV